MASSLIIKTDSKNYSLVFAEDKLQDFILSLKKKHPKSLITIITDENILKFYKNQLNFIDKKTFFLLTLQPGEKSKSITSKLAIEDFLFHNKNNRQSVLVALGGGVIGDLVGFVAATFMRGIAYYMIPTSLLSMVDSSIGGKTGINNSFGKNLIGAFYQPEKILIDTYFLKTLDLEQMRNGLAEVIKAGIIKDNSIFTMVKKHSDAIFKQDKKFLINVIKKSIKVKREVVAKDEKENNYRRILNFGHTFGHGLELLSKYKLLHGFAISLGMVIEAFFSLRLGLLAEKDFKEIVAIFKKVGLLYRLSELPFKISAKKLYQIMLLDKKSTDNKLYINTIKKVGEVNSHNGSYRLLVPEEKFFEYFAEFQKAEKTF